MNLLWLLVAVLVVLALVGSPVGPVTHSYGWYPSGGLSMIVVILVVLLLLRVI